MTTPGASSQNTGSPEVRAYLREVDETLLPLPEHGRQRSALVAAATQCLAPLGQVRWEPVGSARCGLGLAGYSDIDLVAVFLDPFDHGIDESVLPYSMKKLRSALAAHSELPKPIEPDAASKLFWERLSTMDLVPGYAAPKLDRPAVTFASLTDQPSVDLVPGVQAGFLWGSANNDKPSSALVTVAYPTDENRWLGTAPELHAGALDYQGGGQDYTCRDMIRLIKLIKYRRGIAILSYFIELYVMRWLEGSHEYPGDSIGDIVANVGARWTFRLPDGYLVWDVPALLTDFARQLRAAAEAGSDFVMIDLTTPEKLGTVKVAAATAGSFAAAFAEAADQARAAALAAERGDAAAGIAIWRQLLQPAARVPGQRLIPPSGQLHGTIRPRRLTPADSSEPPDDLRRTMAGCTWIFAPDGRCLLAPGPAASVRDDIFPLPGRWTADGGMLRLDCRRRGSGETVYRLTGTITEDDGQLMLMAAIEFTGANQAGGWRRTGRFEQPLSAVKIAHADPEDGLAGLRRLASDTLTPPLVYTMSVAGHDGMRPFPAVRTQLVLRQPPSSDRGPLAFTLGIGGEDVIGNIVWLSHLGDNDFSRGYDTAITLADGTLTAEYAHEGLQIAVSWLAGSLPRVPSSPAFSTHARMELTFTGDDVTGTVEATGTLVGRPLAYAATLTGYRLRPRVPLVPARWPPADPD